MAGLLPVRPRRRGRPGHRAGDARAADEGLGTGCNQLSCYYNITCYS